MRVWVTGAFILLGVMLLLILTVPAYSRALILSGRSEVVAMRLDDPEFGHFALGRGTWLQSPDQPAEPGEITLDLDRDTLVRFVRQGRGPLRLSFEPAVGAPPGACVQGGKQVGTRVAGGETVPVCDVSSAVIAMPATRAPLVIAVSGRLTVGEEVSQGAGAGPILLEATASLLVRHAGLFFRMLCHAEVLEHVCERFTANTVTLSPGNFVRMQATEHERSSGVGFIRIDPASFDSGMMVLLSAEARAFEVFRIEGESYTIRESLFDVISKSPLAHTLNGMLAAAGLIWFFLRVGRKDGTHGGHEACIALFLLLAAPGQGRAQQALLRSETNGQAMLRARGDRCYAVTVQHVVGGETLGTLVAPGRAIGEANVLRTIPAAPEPVVLMTTQGLPPGVCPAFEPPPTLDDWLRSHSFAMLRLVRPDGSWELLPLALGAVDAETLTVTSATALAQGMSGGTVLVADRPVELLADLTREGRTGRVMRLDRVFERLSPHLAAAVAPVLVRTGSAVPYEVVRSDAEPVSPSNGASNLQAGAEPWRVATQGHVELTLHVTAPVSVLSLDVTGVPDAPRSAELLGSRSPSGPWQSMASMTLEAGDTVQAKQLPPTAFPYLLVRLYPAAGAHTVALTRMALSSG